MSKTSGYHENGGLSKKFFEKFEFREKNAVKNESKILKNLFYANFFITNYIFSASSSLACSRSSNRSSKAEEVRRSQKKKKKNRRISE